MEAHSGGGGGQQQPSSGHRSTGAGDKEATEALREAVETCQPGRVIELLKMGAPSVLDAEGQTPLHLAAANGHLQLVDALIQAGCDVTVQDFTGHTALQRASAEGHLEVIRALLENGVSVDHQDEVHGNTALHEAAWKGFSQSVGVLCKAKANAYIKNRGGFAPLHLCCQNGHNETCRVLLLAGCKPDIKNNYGDTPLHTSARYGHAGVIRILVSAKCNPSEQNKNGDTALHIAAAMGRRKLTRVLLESGCNPRVKNKQQETATEIAQRKNLTEILQILRNPPPPTHQRQVSQSRLNTSHSSGNAFGGLDVCGGPDVDDVIDDEVSDGDEDQILVMEEEDVDGQVHRYPEPHQKYKNSHHQHTSSSLQPHRRRAVPSSSRQHGHHQRPQQPSGHHHQFPSIEDRGQRRSGRDPRGHRRSKRRSAANHHNPHLLRSPYHDSNDGGGHFEDIVQDLLDEATDVEANHGGQYYLDLAGNVRRGPPVAHKRGGHGGTHHQSSCHCAPIFSKFEKRLERDKDDLIRHIDHSQVKLDARLASLEKKTKEQLFGLNQAMKESLAAERGECLDRMERRAIRERMAIERQQVMRDLALKRDLAVWLDARLTEIERKHNLDAKNSALLRSMAVKRFTKHKKSSAHNQEPRTKSADGFRQSDEYLSSGQQLADPSGHLDFGNSSLCVSDHPMGGASVGPAPQVPLGASSSGSHDRYSSGSSHHHGAVAPPVPNPQHNGERFQPVLHHQYNSDALNGYNQDGQDFQHLEVSSRPTYPDMYSHHESLSPERRLDFVVSNTSDSNDSHNYTNFVPTSLDSFSSNHGGAAGAQMHPNGSARNGSDPLQPSPLAENFNTIQMVRPIPLQSGNCNAVGTACTDPDYRLAMAGAGPTMSFQNGASKMRTVADLHNFPSSGDEVDIHHALPVYLPSDGASSDDACWKSQHQVASPHQVGVAPGGEEQRADGASAVDGGQPPVPARLPAHQQPLQGQKSPYFPPIVNQFPSRSIKPMLEPLDEGDQTALDDDVSEMPESKGGSGKGTVVDRNAKPQSHHSLLTHHLSIKTGNPGGPAQTEACRTESSVVTGGGGGTTGSITSTTSSHSSSTSPQDSHNDSGYSTRIGFSAGPSPSLSGSRPQSSEGEQGHPHSQNIEESKGHREPSQQKQLLLLDPMAINMIPPEMENEATAVAAAASNNNNAINSQYQTTSKDELVNSLEDTLSSMRIIENSAMFGPRGSLV